MESANRLQVRRLGQVDYQACWQAMQDFTEARDENTPDELWLLQHSRVFTQGRAGRAEHLLAPADSPGGQVDRGGQATDHGPGQSGGAVLVRLRRRGLRLRALGEGCEQ